jgi:hypothetical protein
MAERPPAPACAEAHYTPRMPEPARTRRPSARNVPVDPHAVERAYRLERARRRARVRRQRQKRWAGIRFLLVLAALLALSVYLFVTVLRQVERLFGL